MRPFLDRIDNNLGTFRLSLITGDNSKVSSTLDAIQADLELVMSDLRGKDYGQYYNVFVAEFPKILREYVSAGTDAVKATKALDKMVRVLYPLKAVVVGQPVKRNDI